MRFRSSYCSERVLHFQDWNAATAKSCSEILRIYVQLLIFAVKIFSLNALKNIFLKIWSIFDSKALNIR